MFLSVNQYDQGQRGKAKIAKKLPFAFVVWRSRVAFVKFLAPPPPSCGQSGRNFRHLRQRSPTIFPVVGTLGRCASAQSVQKCSLAAADDANFNIFRNIQYRKIGHGIHCARVPTLHYLLSLAIDLAKRSYGLSTSLAFTQHSVPSTSYYLLSLLSTQHFALSTISTSPSPRGRFAPDNAAHPAGATATGRRLRRWAA